MKKTKKTPKEIYLKDAKDIQLWQDNIYYQSTIHFTTIEERIAGYKSYFQTLSPHIISQIPEAEVPKNQNVIAENRPLYTEFSTMIWLHSPDGYSHAIYNDAMLSTHVNLPFCGKLHTHDFIEFMYVVDGFFDQRISGEMHHFTRGDIVIMDQNSEHMDMINEKTGTVVFLLLSSEFLDSVLKYYENRDYLYRFLFDSLRMQRDKQKFLHLKSAFDEDEIKYLLEQLFYEDYRELPGKKEMIRWNLIRMFRVICEKYTIQIYSSNSQEGKEKMLLSEMEKYIQFHLAEITVQNLEIQFHYHRNYYNNILKKYKNQTFREYVQTLRMERAALLLCETDLPIKQIALHVGYENTSFFYNLFAKHYGKSPQEYKQSH